ncbi:ribosome-inactivating family protein [Streptomyces libani]|uniref:ribosome-inactivating family protein n=1 Tax=Streptomyces nigrescens TaxID=1920 RepID=UPI0037F14FF9
MSARPSTKGKLPVTAETMNRAVNDFADKGAHAAPQSLCQPAVVLAEAARFKQATDQVKTNWKGKDGVLSQKVRNYTLNWDKLSRYAFWQTSPKSANGDKDTNEPNHFNVGTSQQPQYVYRTGTNKPLVWDTLTFYTGNGRRYGTCGGVFEGKRGQPAVPAHAVGRTLAGSGLKMRDWSRRQLGKETQARLRRPHRQWVARPSSLATA